jgi:hypothetical protein
MPSFLPILRRGGRFFWRRFSVSCNLRTIPLFWIGEVGQRKFSFIYRIVDGSDEETVYAKGKSVMVLFDYKQNTAVPIPKDFLEKLLPYREDKEA